jgi:hypothetical protein
MTALCGGGASQAKLGVAAVVNYTAGLLASIFAAYDLAWLIPVIPLVGLPPLVLDNFCSTDPPAVPTFTEDEANALLNLQFGPTFDTAAEKFRDLVLNLLWYQSCECASGTPSPFVPPSQPAGAITTYYPSGQAGGPCQTFEVEDLVYQPNTSLDRGQLRLLETGEPYVVRATLRTSVATAPGIFVEFQLKFENDAAGITSLYTYALTLGPAQTVIRYFPIYPNSTDVDVSIHALAGSGETSAGATLELFCSGASPNTPGPSTGPNDVAGTAVLEQLLALVKAVQRNYAPFGYIRGVSHTGISGSGSIAVSRILGVDVAVTAVPAGKQELLGNPPYIKDLGWLSVSEADGMIQERRLAQHDFTWFPQLAPLATSVNYALQPGVVVTITELLPEP